MPSHVRIYTLGSRGHLQSLDELRADVLCYLWHYGVPEGVEAISVHRRGNPINHSTHVGFTRPGDCMGRPTEMRTAPVRVGQLITVPPACRER